MLNDTPLRTYNTVKDFGHYIQDDLRDDKDISRECRKLYGQCNMVVRKLCTVETKVKLFRTFYSSLPSYGVTIVNIL